MHESGGQLTLIGRLIVMIAGCVFAIGFVADLMKHKNAVGLISGIGSFIFFGYVAYKLYTYFKR